MLDVYASIPVGRHLCFQVYHGRQCGVSRLGCGGLDMSRTDQRTVPWSSDSILSNQFTNITTLSILPQIVHYTHFITTFLPLRM